LTSATTNALFAAFLFAALALPDPRCRAVENGAEEAAGGIELIRDPRFERGFNVHDPKAGKKVVRDIFRWGDSSEEPVWGLSQWHSRFSIAGAESQESPSGAVRWANESKAIVVGPRDSGEADLTLEVDSRPEWRGQSRQKGQPWPHLLVGQRISDCPQLSELASLRFRVRARLIFSERFETADYDPRLHTAHYLIHFTVQNLNRESSGHGDFLWFGIPVYDDRHRVPRRHVAADAASKKLIYNLGGEAFTTASLHDGAWTTLEADLAPTMRDALREAWKRGFLDDSREFSDYRIGAINMGWEVTGINRACLQVRDLSVVARKHR
jgi:hypothetical protein